MGFNVVETDKDMNDFGYKVNYFDIYIFADDSMKNTINTHKFEETIGKKHIIFDKYNDYPYLKCNERGELIGMYQDVQEIGDIINGRVILKTKETITLYDNCDNGYFNGEEPCCIFKIGKKSYPFEEYKYNYMRKDLTLLFDEWTDWYCFSFLNGVGIMYKCDYDSGTNEIKLVNCDGEFYDKEIEGVFVIDNDKTIYIKFPNDDKIYKISSN